MNVSLGFAVILRILPVNIQSCIAEVSVQTNQARLWEKTFGNTIKSQVFDYPHSGLSKGLAPLVRGRRLRKIHRIGPSSDRKEDFQVAVLLLEEK